jgi:hypothetical protein
MEFPGTDGIEDPVIDLRYEIQIWAKADEVWPWTKQMGYHRAGWYIDTWWDEFAQRYFWPRVVPKEARGTYKAPADEILPEFQDIRAGDIIPDGPPGSAYYHVVEVQENRLLLLYATTHFNYMAPRFVYKTRFAPSGAFCWAFILEKKGESETTLISWWQAEGYPRPVFTLLKPFLILVDGLHQRKILQGIKKRVEGKRWNHPNAR